MRSEANGAESQTDWVCSRVCAGGSGWGGAVNLSAPLARVCVQIIQSTAHLLASRSVFTPN